MLETALVEDDRIFAKLEEKLIQESWKLAEELQFATFDSAEGFLEEVRGGRHFDILIADIELPGMNGIELGKALKVLDERVAVVFLTSHDGFALESYRLDAEQYVMKSEIKTRLPEVLNQIGEKLTERRERYRFITEEGELRKIVYQDVLYFYKDGKYVKYRLKDDFVRERTSLGEAFQETGGFPFVKVERGYVVNVSFVKKITENQVHMTNGDIVPVSRRMLPEVRREITRNRSRL